MKKLFKSITCIVLTALFISGCRKADTSNVVTDDSYASFMAANGVPVETFTIDAATGGTVACKRGTKITFPPNAFANPDNSITTGNVQVLVKEALLKKQWILEGLSATTINEMLISGGMLDINVKRSSDGVEVKPSPAMLIPTPSLANVIKVEMPRNPALPDTIKLFLPVQQGGNTGNAPTAWAASYYPFGKSPNSYIFQLPQFRWVNCDALYGVPGPKTTIKVTPDLTGISGATNVQVMMVYRNLSTVITLQPFSTYMQSYSNSIPVGSTADIVCIGKDGAGNIIFKVLPATVFTAGMDVPVKPVVTSAATVTAYLNSIN